MGMIDSIKNALLGKQEKKDLYPLSRNIADRAEFLKQTKKDIESGVIEDNNKNITQLFYKHLSVLSESTFYKLCDYFSLSDNDEEKKKSDIIEYECFIFALITFICRVKKLNYLTTKDEHTFEYILDNLIYNYKNDYLELNECIPLFSDEFFILIENRLDIFESLYIGKEGIDNITNIIILLYYIFNSEFIALEVVSDNLKNFMKRKLIIKAGKEGIKIVYHFILNIFGAVDLFFKDGFSDYLDKEMKPTNDFLEKEKICFEKYFNNTN